MVELLAACSAEYLEVLTVEKKVQLMADKLAC
jgi:hypothetical protein